MGNLIRRLGIVCIAMIVAVTVLLSPANAVAMLDCDVQQPIESVYHHEHSKHVDAVSASQDSDGSTHLADHCAAHACVVAVAAPSVHPESLHLNQCAGFRMQNNALVAGVSPEGLRRPPRV